MKGKALKRRTAGHTTLYDVGNAPIIWFFYGGPGLVIGAIVDFFWNLLVLTAGLWYLRPPATSTMENTVPSFTMERKMNYCFFITLLGIPIEFAYLMLVGMLEPIHIILQILLMVVPIGLLWLANYLLSKSYLKLDRRQATIIASIMAFFTAPWLLLILLNVLL